jgi:hypothetical protein
VNIAQNKNKLLDLLTFLDNQKRAAYTIGRNLEFGNKSICELAGFRLSRNYSLSKVSKISDRGSFSRLILLQSRLSKNCSNPDLLNMYCESCSLGELVSMPGMGTLVLKNLVLLYMDISKNSEKFDSAVI